MSDAQVNVIEACAVAAHEVNRIYCIFTGDRSQPSWDNAPDWQKASSLNGVRGALAGNTPEQSHESWLKEKKETGWKYGPVKDPEKKEHPCFLPYGELPVEQQAKDHLFLATVRSVAKALGAQPEKERIAELLAEVSRLDKAIHKLQVERIPHQMALNAYRKKCPTCRCKLLPGETCRCCAEPPCLDDEP